MSENRGRREIRGHQEVRAAAKDWETYSSDLQGDQDVRSYRQLPLEADPPRHTLIRTAVQPIFMSSSIEPKAARFEEHARKLIAAISAAGGGDVTYDLALPYVIGCLSIIYNRPQDYEEWLSWGTSVWTAQAHMDRVHSGERLSTPRPPGFDRDGERSGDVLESYLARVFDAAEPIDDPDPIHDDIWDIIAGLKVGGEPITRAEMFGIANVLLAGGRDTVIKLISGLTWHLIDSPEDRQFLASNPDAFNRTLAEMVRFLSPLASIGRVVHGEGPEFDEHVVLHFLSANRDPSIWPDPNRLDIHRPKAPHLAFGFGRHSCLGMNITEHEARAFLNVILNEWPGWEFDGEPLLEWSFDDTGEVAIASIHHFDYLRVLAPSR